MSAASTASIEQLAINTIRTLSMDAVQQANSGHPGTPMALAPACYALWNNVLAFDPAEPLWLGRDRFVLSCGHASMLLYSVLHLTQVKSVDEAGRGTDQLAISLESIRRFRQLGSPCAGHPEYGHAAGIETTTGPLGQGIATSVGMAAACMWLGTHYNRPGLELFNNKIYALCSDGDLMEGVGYEAASLAGHLKLSNLCWIYDDNRITIEGETDLAFSEDVATRFRGLGWHVLHVDDANDIEKLTAAYESFRGHSGGPTLIIVRSVIAWGSPNKANTHGAHGAPLGDEEIKLTKAAYGWPVDAKFDVPGEVLDLFAEGVGKRGADLRNTWESLYAAYETKHPELAAELQGIQSGSLPEDWDAQLPSFAAGEKLATRAASGKVLQSLSAAIPWLLGGSADLAPSNNTLIKGEDGFSASNYGGRNFHFGIREHAMAAMGNGLALCGLRPYVATFFVFSDYLRPALRLSTLMHQPVLYIFTHDSIGLGEDGPTHQPIEHLAACRAIPGLVVVRPADANEVCEAYRVAISQTNQPTALILSRQGLPTISRDTFAAASGVARGAYILADSADSDVGEPEVVLIGTGSELQVAQVAFERLSSTGRRARLISMPSWELFEAQDEAYREQVLPSRVQARVAVEAGVAQGWERYLGQHGEFVGMSSFGASAPAADLYEHFGITAERVCEAAERSMAAAVGQ